jgi:exopolysaccharide biosynthesis protein
MNSKELEKSRTQKSKFQIVIGVVFLVMMLIGLGFVFWKGLEILKTKNLQLSNLELNLKGTKEASNSIEASLSAEIEKLNNEDLRKTNNGVLKEINSLKNAYKNTLENYRKLLELKELTNKTATLDSSFASILEALEKDNLEKHASLSAKFKADIEKELSKLATAVKIPTNTLEKNEAPNSGFSRQKVTVGANSYLVDIIAADLNSTKVIVDTASDGTCTNDCPVLPLATYVSRSGAYAGINGTYFCPDTYPDCASKKNTFDVLVMNKNKVYFNSDNNIYSTVPVAVFSGNSARFIRESKDWGRDSGVDSVIANRPLLVLDGNAMFSGSGEPKEGAKGNRSFLGSSGSTAYMGIVHGATVAESATVLQAMGVKNAINLDSGGSSALWNGGYKAGPGRNLPNAVLFVRK